MRYIQIPNPVVLRRLRDGKPIVYGMRMLNEENVFGKPIWREKGKVEMFESIHAKFEASEYAPGAWVTLTDEEFEVYGPLAIMKGQDLAPDIAYDLTKVMKCIIMATSDRPAVLEPPKDQTPAPAEGEN
jgi:hypothetical protein